MNKLNYTITALITTAGAALAFAAVTLDREWAVSPILALGALGILAVVCYTLMDRDRTTRIYLEEWQHLAKSANDRYYSTSQQLKQANARIEYQAQMLDNQDAAALACEDAEYKNHELQQELASCQSETDAIACERNMLAQDLKMTEEALRECMEAADDQAKTLARVIAALHDAVNGYLTHDDKAQLKQLFAHTMRKIGLSEKQQVNDDNWEDMLDRLAAILVAAERQHEQA